MLVVPGPAEQVAGVGGLQPGRLDGLPGGVIGRGVAVPVQRIPGVRDGGAVEQCPKGGDPGRLGLADADRAVAGLAAAASLVALYVPVAEDPAEQFGLNVGDREAGAEVGGRGDAEPVVPGQLDLLGGDEPDLAPGVSPG